MQLAAVEKDRSRVRQRAARFSRCPAAAVFAGARAVDVAVPGELAVVGVDDLPATALARHVLAEAGVATSLP